MNLGFPCTPTLLGKVAEGKRCRRTTDLQPQKQTTNSSSHEHIIKEAGTLLETVYMPSAFIRALGKQYLYRVPTDKHSAK